MMVVETYSTEHREFSMPSGIGRDFNADNVPVSPFHSLEQKLTLLASTIIVGPDSIRSGVRGQYIAEHGNEDEDSKELRDYGMIAIELPIRTKLPHFVKSHIDVIANEFKSNYTTRPCTVSF